MESSAAIDRARVIRVKLRSRQSATSKERVSGERRRTVAVGMSVSAPLAKAH